MERTITVTGTGSATAAPDLVTLTLGVETRRETAAKAYDDAGDVSGRRRGKLASSGYRGRGPADERAEPAGRCDVG